MSEINNESVLFDFSMMKPQMYRKGYAESRFRYRKRNCIENSDFIEGFDTEKAVMYRILIF